MSDDGRYGPGTSHVRWLEHEYRKAALTQQVTDAVTQVLTEICNNPHVLLTVAAAGPMAWQNRARKIFAGFPVPESVYDLMWAYLAKRAGPEPGRRLDDAERHMADDAAHQGGPRDIDVTTYDHGDVRHEHYDA